MRRRKCGDSDHMLRRGHCARRQSHLARRGAVSPPVAGAGSTPSESVTHFLVKLVFAAPLSFFSAAAIPHDLLASRSHLSMKLLRAAPASFWSSACALQVGPWA